MAEFVRGEITIHYTDSGPKDAVPVLLIAPGGMRSAIPIWSQKPWDPLRDLEGYRVIAMDQRNAGESFAPITKDDGWHSYTADQLALMDHLGAERFHVVGMCIGGPYIMGLIRAAPDRVLSAVMFQPIGLDDNREVFMQLFDDWARDIQDEHPEADQEVWHAFRQAMFGGTYMFNASEQDISACETPMLLFMGDDIYHPQAVSRDIASRARNLTFVEQWKAPELHDGTHREIMTFLSKHDPSPGSDVDRS